MRWVLTAVVAVCVAAVGTTTAHAGRYKVVIETEPPGATVYFDNTESTPVCQKTPCTIDLPAVETAIYIQLDKHTPEIEMLDPAKKGQKIKKVLKLAIGNLIIKNANGAQVQINDEDKGKAPDTFELAEGAYHVVVTAPGGKILFDDYVEVTAGEDNTITPIGTSVAEGGGDTDEIDKGITKPGPSRPRGNYLVASVTTDIGFRKFTYENNTGLREDDETGQVLLGPTVEVWPTQILGLGKLPGLFVMAQYLYHVNSLQVVGKNLSMTNPPKTFWQNVKAGLGYRWTIADLVGLEVSGGYGRDTVRFSGDDIDIAMVPDADYQTIRLGARVAAALGKAEPYIAFENRIVLDGGAVGTRFDSSASGLYGAIGVAVRTGPISARLEGSRTQYSWTFTPSAGNPTGATDAISKISLSVGYAY